MFRMYRKNASRIESVVPGSIVILAFKEDVGFVLVSKCENKVVFTNLDNFKSRIVDKDEIRTLEDVSAECESIFGDWGNPICVLGAGEY